MKNNVKMELRVKSNRGNEKMWLMVKEMENKLDYIIY